MQQAVILHDQKAWTRTATDQLVARSADCVSRD